MVSFPEPFIEREMNFYKRLLALRSWVCVLPLSSVSTTKEYQGKKEEPLAWKVFRESSSLAVSLQFRALMTFSIYFDIHALQH